MAFKARKKPAPRPPAKPAPKKRAPAEPVAIEHRIAVTGVALAVSYGRDRTERMELRGTAALNAGAGLPFRAIVSSFGVADLSPLGPAASTKLTPSASANVATVVFQCFMRSSRV